MHRQVGSRHRGMPLSCPSATLCCFLLTLVNHPRTILRGQHRRLRKGNMHACSESRVCCCCCHQPLFTTSLPLRSCGIVPCRILAHNKSLQQQRILPECFETFL